MDMNAEAQTLAAYLKFYEAMKYPTPSDWENQPPEHVKRSNDSVTLQAWRILKLLEKTITLNIYGSADLVAAYHDLYICPEIGITLNYEDQPRQFLATFWLPVCGILEGLAELVQALPVWGLIMALDEEPTGWLAQPMTRPFTTYTSDQMLGYYEYYIKREIVALGKKYPEHLQEYEAVQKVPTDQFTAEALDLAKKYKHTDRVAWECLIEMIADFLGHYSGPDE